MPILSIVFIDYVFGSRIRGLVAHSLGKYRRFGPAPIPAELPSTKHHFGFPNKVVDSPQQPSDQQGNEFVSGLFSQRSASEIAGRSQLVDNLSALIMGPLGKSFIGLLTATVYCLVMFWFETNLTFIVLGIALVNLLYFSWQVRRSRTQPGGDP